MAVTGAGLEGIVAAESKICYIDGDAGILSYQGYNIHTLADHATFEEVIYLLWYGRLPKQAELDQLKEKYKDDQTRFGQEQLKLFKQAGVNPLGETPSCFR